MKVVIKATGEIIEISEGCSYLYAENYDKTYNLNEVKFLDVKEKSFSKDESDYWTRLKHQYAGMAMQGILSNDDLLTALCNGHREVPISKIVLDNADIIATALVNKLKEK